MILDLDNLEKGEEKLVPTPPATGICHSSPPLRMWFNILMEIRDGKAYVIKSYSMPAKDSQVEKFKVPKKKKKKAKELSEVKVKSVEEY